MRGWYWWYLFQGKIPEIQIGNQKVPLMPGRGMGWLIWYGMLTGQKPEIKVTERDEMEELKKMVQQLAEQIELIKKKLEEIERR